MIRIAMVSGPRNCSTALMRSFEARGDCHVVDEPLYAAYLARTGIEHPDREAILASQPTTIDAALSGLERGGPLPLQYEKHMAQHIPRDDSLSWLEAARVALLIRHPARVVPSFARVRGLPHPDELGYHQQAKILASCNAIVVNSADLLRDPARVLKLLCARLKISWTPKMLSWPSGPRPSDGVWAPHWYGQVWKSTAFGPPATSPAEVSETLQPVVDALMPVWRRLEAAAI